MNDVVCHRDAKKFKLTAAVRTRRSREAITHVKLGVFHVFGCELHRGVFNTGFTERLTSVKPHKLRNEKLW